MDHLASRIQYQLSGSDDIDQSTSSSTKQPSDEMLEDIKAIAELEPSGITLFTQLFCFLCTNCINSTLFGGVLLLVRQPLVQKRLFTGKFKRINTNSQFRPIANCFFLFLFCFAKNVQGSICDIGI